MDDNTFWEKIKLSTETNKEVKIIKSINESTIVLAGYMNDVSDIRKNQGFIDVSFDSGKNWRNFLLGCHVITQLNSKDNILIATGIKYISDTYQQIVHFKYDFIQKDWKKFELPNGIDGDLLEIIDDNTYLFDITENQFGNIYLKTVDGGKTWSKHHVLMEDKKDQFQQYCIQDNNIWGVRTPKTINEKTESVLISIDINSWKIVNEIPLGKYIINKKGYPLSNHWISNIGNNEGKLYILGEDQINNKGYIWQINDNKSALNVVESFTLKKSQIPDKIFLYKDTLLITISELFNFMPSYSLLFKSRKTTWKSVAFPSAINPSISFNNGKLLGTTIDNYIYSKQF